MVLGYVGSKLKSELIMLEAMCKKGAVRKEDYFGQVLRPIMAPILDPNASPFEECTAKSPRIEDAVPIHVTKGCANVVRKLGIRTPERLARVFD